MNPTSSYVAHNLEGWHSRLRSRVHAFFNRVSRWLDDLQGIKRRLTWRQRMFYHVIDTRLPRYDFANGEWVARNPAA